ncbi:MAG: GNAT family N-acetyltransferase [Phycisphaerales bacterium]|jgi:GNAT superfamily N-acetyltransferase|nr:GNAT family N-acetyltransferase [Phycisphaerales bacterium]
MHTKPRTLSESTALHTIADQMDHLFRAMLSSDDALRTPKCFRYITGQPHPLGNLAIFSRDATPDDIARDAAALRDAPLPTAILFLDEGTPAQRAAASALGFHHAESMPAMSVTPATLASTTMPDGYAIREVGPDDAESWSIAMSDGYGVPRGIGSLFGIDRAAQRLPGALRYFAAEHKGRMVATSTLCLHDGLAGIYCVATLPDHRGKGLGAHLTAEPLRTAWGMGYTTGVLQASEMGAPVYTRIGFRTHGHMELLVRIPQ